MRNLAGSQFIMSILAIVFIILVDVLGLRSSDKKISFLSKVPISVLSSKLKIAGREGGN